MEGLLSYLGFGFGLAFLAGFRAFFPLVYLGLLGRFAPTTMLHSPLTILSSSWILLILLFFLIWELMAEKWPVRRPAQNVLIYPARLVAGGILAASVTVGSGRFWVFLFGVAISALGLWLSLQLRPIMADFFNEYKPSFLSTLEDILVIASFALLVLAPWLTYLLGIVIAVLVVRKINNGDKRPRRRTLR